MFRYVCVSGGGGGVGTAGEERPEAENFLGCVCGGVLFQMPGERWWGSWARRYKAVGSVRTLVGADISC